MATTVLVADDDAAIRTVLRMALEEEGYTVVQACNGREALERLAEQRPDLLLLDLNMPVMTGWEVFTQLRANESRVPVVLMTARDRPEAEAARQGANACLAKPFDLDRLLQLVQQFAS